MNYDLASEKVNISSNESFLTSNGPFLNFFLFSIIIMVLSRPFTCFSGTAACATSGLIATQRVTGKRIADQKFLFLGAGEAGLGVANLLVLLLRDMGVNPADAYKKIWLYDGNIA